MSEYCYKLAKNKLPTAEIDDKKKKVYDYLLKKIDHNFTKITSKFVNKTFIILDKVYFDNNITKRIIETNSKLTFKVSGRLTTTAGRCNHQYYLDDNGKFNYGIFTIEISRPIIENLFKNKEHELKINGLTCYNKLECYINLYQHEITHLLISIFCHKEGSYMGGHTRMFKAIVYNLFGHTDYKHMLLSGDNKILEEKEFYNKTNIEIGDYVISKIKNKVFEGLVYKMTSKYVYIKISDEKLLSVPFHSIDKIKKSDKKLVNTQKLLPHEIKNKLKKDDIIYVKLKGVLRKGKIISLNKTRASVLLEDGKKWYIPYCMIQHL